MCCLARVSLIIWSRVQFLLRKDYKMVICMSAIMAPYIGAPNGDSSAHSITSWVWHALDLSVTSIKSHDSSTKLKLQVQRANPILFAEESPIAVNPSLLGCLQVVLAEKWIVDMKISGQASTVQLSVLQTWGHLISNKTNTVTWLTYNFRQSVLRINLLKMQ